MERIEQMIHSQDQAMVLSGLKELVEVLITAGRMPDVPRFHVNELRLDRVAERVRAALAQRRRNGLYPSDVPRVDEWLTELLLRGHFVPPLTWEERARELLAIVLRFGSTYPALVGTVGVKGTPEAELAFGKEWTTQLADLPLEIERPDAQFAASEALAKLLEMDAGIRDRVLASMMAWPDDPTLLRIALHAISHLPLSSKKAFMVRALAIPELHNTLAHKLVEWATFDDVDAADKRWLESIKSSLDPDFVGKPDPIEQARFGS
jgi:hypothetical protein